MAWSERVGVVTVVLLALGGICAEATTRRGGNEPPGDRVPVTQSVAVAAAGRIVGSVTDTAGAPLVGAVISAFGPSGAELALVDADGRFLLRFLAPGAYLVQAHLPGFVASRRQLVAVSASTSAVHAITLSRLGQASAPTSASVGLPLHTDSPSQPEGPDEAPLDGPGTETSAPHDHSEKAWRFRRARRSVLKDAEAWMATAAPRGLVSGVVAPPLTGEVNLLTRSTLESATDMLTGEARPAGIANLSVGAPLWQGDWLARGAMTTGDVTSWVVSGAYAADVETSHRLGLDVSYGRQRYEGGNPAALTLTSESRYAASVGASDRWTVSPQLTVDYGARYATYGYIEEDGLFSPRVVVTVTPVARARIRVGGSQETVAPGAEEFLPPTDSGLWLPPERTFSAVSPWGRLHPERTRHVEVGLEYDLTDRSVVGVRRFYQDVSDQMATLFGVDEFGNASTGHYYLARAGSVTSRGWAMTLRRQLGDRFSGSVDYTVAEAHWRQAGVDAVLADAAPGLMRSDVERFHDVSGTFEAEITGTDTLVVVRCRVNTAFVRADSEDPTGLDARFDVRVNQALPYSPFEGSQWEVLIAVRSLFFEPQAAASTFDELLVARAPKQFVGGLVVHF